MRGGTGRARAAVGARCNKPGARPSSALAAKDQHARARHANCAKPTPAPDARYELCTRLGLYVIDEANIETHGFDPLFLHDANHPAHSSGWLGAMMERATRWAAWGRGRLTPQQHATPPL